MAFHSHSIFSFIEFQDTSHKQTQTAHLANHHPVVWQND